MAKDIDNLYHPSASYVGVNSLAESNPYAEDGNAVQLYGIETYGDRHSVSFTWAVTTAGDRVAFTPVTNPTSAADYYKFRVVDQHANEAYGNFASSAPTAAINVNTSSLDPNDNWLVEFATSSGSGASRVRFSFRIGTGAIYANSSGTVSHTLS